MAETIKRREMRPLGMQVGGSELWVELVHEYASDGPEDRWKMEEAFIVARESLLKACGLPSSLMPDPSPRR